MKIKLKGTKMGKNIMNFIAFVLCAIVVVSVLGAVVAMALFGGAVILGLGAILVSVGVVGYALWLVYERFSQR